MSKTAIAVTLLLVATLIQAACEVGPDYHRPVQDVGGPAFKSAATQPTTRAATQPTTQPAPITLDWWRLYHDPLLTQLEEAAIRANPGLKAAVARVLQARAAARITQSQFYPVITADPSLTRSRQLTNLDASNGGAVTSNLYSIPFDLTYEVDVWGRVRRSVESSKATARASSSDYVVVLQTLTADVAQDYFTIRSYDDQDRILGRTVESYRQQVALVKTQYDAGIAAKIDLLQAQTQLDSTVTQQVDNQRLRVDLEHALAILLGRPPSELNVPYKPLDLLPPAVPVGLPSELLRHRPDVVEAEQTLMAQSAQIGVSEAAFFPQLNLAGSAGFESISISRALNWQDRVWSIGPSLAMPIFEGGSLTATLEQTKARYTELAENYRTSVLSAIQDVEDSLTNLHMYADESTAQARAVTAAADYVQLAEVEYRTGLVNYLTVIDAERTLLTAKLSAAQILNQRLDSSVLLIKALGGGWDARHPTTQPAATQPAMARPAPTRGAATQPVAMRAVR